MDARMDLFGNEVATRYFKRLAATNQPLTEAGLSPTTMELVKLRASQINGCGVCTDMHYKDAIAAGEDPVRLNMVAAWREATVFTEAERAALELAEQGTRIADAAGGVPDDVWRAAEKHFDEEQLGALVAVISLINVYNRFNVIIQQPAGFYQPGMKFG